MTFPMRTSQFNRSMRGNSAFIFYTLYSFYGVVKQYLSETLSLNDVDSGSVRGNACTRLEEDGDDYLSLLFQVIFEDGSTESNFCLIELKTLKY